MDRICHKPFFASRKEGRPMLEKEHSAKYLILQIISYKLELMICTYMHYYSYIHLAVIFKDDMCNALAVETLVSNWSTNL